METLLKANEQAKNHDVDLSKLPQNLDMTAESITANVHEINANCQDERLKFIFKSLVNHMHDFVRETSLTTEEWTTAIHFLTKTGKISSRPEFILLSDTLGVSTLVDSINNAKPPGATEATVLGPFYADDAHEVEKGDSIASEGKGDYMYVEGVVKDLRGNLIPNAIIDTWETDGHGQYDNQYESRDGPDCRGRLHSAEDGSYAFRAVVPVSYSVPVDGTVGEMLSKLGRHVYRPAHLHIRINAPGYEELITALYFKGPYVTSDAVFGVKSSLIVEPKVIDDLSLSKARGFKEAKPHVYLKQDFVLGTVDECVEARRKAGPN